MFKVRRTGSFVTDLCLGTGAVLFGLLVLIGTAVTGADGTLNQDLFAAVAVFLTFFGAMLALDLRLNDEHGPEALPAVVLICGGLFLLFAADRTLLVLYLLILVLLAGGIKLCFGRPTLLRLDLGDRTRNLAAGIVLIVLALLAAFFSQKLLVYTAAILALLVLAGGVVLLVSAVRSDRAAPRA